MSPDLMEHTPLSRRKLLKRAGVVGGALWAAPVLASSASAGHGRRHTCGRGFQCGGDVCGGQTPCKPPDPSCTCIQRLAGGGTLRCFCHQASFCSDLTSCDQGSDCPEGWACAASCCSFGDPNVRFCHPPCGTPAAGNAQGSGRMSTG
jgi:hypothetical protein